jgi:uncharacterized protein (TIGR03000 family)
MRSPEVTPAPTEKRAQEQARARVRIDVPEDAKLYVDGQLMKTASARRVYQTPALTPGRAYFYDVRVELERNGQLLTESQRVVVRAGEESSASFATLEQRAAATATARTTEE